MPESKYVRLDEDYSNIAVRLDRVSLKEALPILRESKTQYPIQSRDRTEKNLLKSLYKRKDDLDKNESIDPHGFLGFLTSYESFDLVKRLGDDTTPVTLEMMRRFIKILKSGKAYDENGNPINEALLKKSLDDILKNWDNTLEYLGTEIRQDFTYDKEEDCDEEDGFTALNYKRVHHDIVKKEIKIYDFLDVKRDISLDNWVDGYADSVGLPSDFTTAGNFSFNGLYGGIMAIGSVLKTPYLTIYACIDNNEATTGIRPAKILQ